MSITSIIVTYPPRYVNIRPIVDAIKGQTVESDIIIWDNGGELEDIPGVTIIRSTHNFVCRPRFLICGMVNSDYIFNQDDDHIITDNKLLEKLIEESKACNGRFIGWAARKDYVKEPFHVPADGMGADLVNTGISFYPTQLSNYLSVNPYFYNVNGNPILNKEEYRYADDHWVSKCIAYNKTSINLENGMAELDTGEAISKEPKHISIRQDIAKRFFK